jgi:hypothetical protein
MSGALARGPARTSFVRRRRTHAFLAAAPALLALAACGGDDSAAPIPIDGAAPDGGCAPQLPTRWAPAWKPPRATPHACTDAQIETEFVLCESDSSISATECAAFNRAPANAACRRCLYATEDESSYGPLVYMANRVLRINVAGCLALADGNVSASGCGAQMQAFDTCGDAACMKACAAFDAFTQCAVQAGDTICSSYRSDSACGDRAIYAACLDYKAFSEYYRGVAKLFCAGGFPGGGVPDAGPLDAGNADASPEGGGDSIGRPIDRGAREKPARAGAGEGIER